MRGPVLMLAWEIWRRNCKYACLSVGAVPCFLLFHWAIHSRVHDAAVLAGLSFPWMLFSLFWVFATFNYTEVNPGKGWTGFPYRLFVLPVSTVVLVLLPMLLGMVSVVLVFLAWVKLIFAPLGIVLPPGLAGWLAGLLALDLACFQAAVWSLAGFRVTRTVVLALAGCTLLLCEGTTCGFLFGSASRAQVKDYVFWERCFVLAYTGLALIALVGACYSVGWQRRGGGRGRGRLQAAARALREHITDMLPGGNNPFTSPLTAQFWFEWRQGGVMLPVCVGSALLLLVGPVSWLNRSQMTPDRTLWILFLVLCTPIILAFVIGKAFAKPDFWSMDPALKPFLAIRPLGAGEMVLTKMKVAGLSTLIAWLLVLAAVPVWVILWVDSTTLEKILESELLEWFQTNYSPLSRYGILVLSVWTAMMLTWRGMVGSLWTGLSGSWTFMVGSVALNGVVVVTMLVALFHLDGLSSSQYQTIVRWIGWALALAVIVKLWVAVCCWDLVSRRHLSSKSAARYLLIWAGGTLGIISLACLLCPDTSFGLNLRWLKYLFILMALLVFPLARLGAAPLGLARNRHRL